MKKLSKTKEHPLTAFRKANEARNAMVAKSLPKAQLGKIVKTVAKPAINAVKSTMGYAKPIAQNSTKVAIRPVNRAINPVVKKLDPKIVRKTLNDTRHIKQLTKELKSDRKVAKIALGVGSAVSVGAAADLINTMNQKETNPNTNSAGTKTVVHTGADGKKYVKVTDKNGKTFNKVINKKTGGTVKKPLAKAQYGRAVVSTDKESNYTASGKKIGTGFGKKAEYRNFTTGEGDASYVPTKAGRAAKNEVKSLNRAATKSGNIVIKKTGGVIKSKKK